MRGTGSERPWNQREELTLFQGELSLSFVSCFLVLLGREGGEMRGGERERRSLGGKEARRRGGTSSPSHHTPPLLFSYCPHFSRFERGANGQGGIHKRPLLRGASFSLPDVVSWLETLMAAVDCYNWVLGEELLSPKELFAGIRSQHT